MHYKKRHSKVRALENPPVCYYYDTSPCRQVTSDSTKNTLDIMANDRSIHFSFFFSDTERVNT